MTIRRHHHRISRLTATRIALASPTTQKLFVVAVTLAGYAIANLAIQHISGPADASSTPFLLTMVAVCAAIAAAVVGAVGLAMLIGTARSVRARSMI